MTTQKRSLDWRRHLPKTVKRFDDDEPGVFHITAQCFVHELRYDFNARVGHLMMEDESCTDMAGAIELFRRIDPGVREIATYAGGHPDTGHVFRDGDWQAVDLRSEFATTADWSTANSRGNARSAHCLALFHHWRTESWPR